MSGDFPMFNIVSDGKSNPDLNARKKYEDKSCNDVDKDEDGDLDSETAFEDSHQMRRQAKHGSSLHRVSKVFRKASIVLQHMRQSAALKTRQRSTMRKSQLEEAGFDFKSFGFSLVLIMVMGAVFGGLFKILVVSGLSDIFKSCGTVVTECDCPSPLLGVYNAIRLCSMWAFPVALMVILPCFWYQGISLKNIAIACSLIFLSCFMGGFALRRYPFTAQLAMVAVLCIISVNFYFYVLYGINGLKLIKHMTIVFVWGTTVCAVEYGITAIHPRYYQYLLPMFTGACEVTIIWAMTLVEDSNIQSAVSLLSPCLGIVMGINFNAILTAGTLKELAVTSAITAVIEIIMKAWPAFYVYMGNDLTFGEKMYYKIIVFVEYTPVIAYISMAATNFAPMGQMVRTIHDGCSGENLVSEFTDRFSYVFVFVGCEIFSDFAAWLLVSYIWGLGAIIQPVVLHDWASAACIICPAVWGAICALEASAVIFKFAIGPDVI